MRGYGYGPGSAMMGYSPWAGLFVVMFWLLFLVAVGILIVWAIRQSSHRHPHQMMPPMDLTTPPAAPHQQPPWAAPPQHDEAMAIARKRLAAGEITTQQFEEIRKALGG